MLQPIHLMHTVRSGWGAGMEGGIVNVCNRLPEEFRVSICAIAPEEAFSDFIKRPGSQFFTLPPHRREGVDWALVPRLARLFRRTKVDLVHSHTWGTFLYSVLAARLTGTAIIHGEHGKNMFELTEHNPAKTWARRLLGPRVNRMVTVSDDLRREWIERYRIPERKIVWIPNGVDVTRFRPDPADRAAARRHFGLPESGFMIGSVGRLDPIKNYRLLIDAARIVLAKQEQVAFTVLGDGPCQQELERQAADLGIAGHVHLLGRRYESPRFLQTLDVFVLPSISEGMSNSVIEALATGLPVVCPALPTHREVISAGVDGILIENFTSETLAETLLHLLDDEAERLRLSRAARETACRQFSLQRMVDRHASLYHEVLGRA
jgi:sugar transferase (PEP-CTERM/EpsH1 system associated)